MVLNKRLLIDIDKNYNLFSIILCSVHLTNDEENVGLCGLISVPLFSAIVKTLFMTTRCTCVVDHTGQS